MNWIDQLVGDYYQFLREKTVVSPTSSDWLEISTPFTDAFNDTIDIYAKRQNGHILLSDDGQTLRNLALSGLEVSRSQGRREILQKILLNYGVQLKGDELVSEATEKNFPQKKHNFLSAISEANDMYVLTKHTVGSLFREDVRTFLDTQEIIYTPYFISKGSTGLEFTFDFQVAYKKTELLIKAFNSVNKMKPKQKTTTRTVNASIGVRREVRDKFTDFCNRNGYVIATAVEQALAAWMRERVRMGEGK